MKTQQIMDWWDSKPVDERIALKDKYMPECKYLVNVKAENLIKSGLVKPKA